MSLESLFTLRERNTKPLNPHSMIKGFREVFRQRNGGTSTHTMGVQLFSGLFTFCEQGESLA